MLNTVVNPKFVTGPDNVKTPVSMSYAVLMCQQAFERKPQRPDSVEESPVLYGLQEKFNYDVAVMLLDGRSTMPRIKLVGASSEGSMYCTFAHPTILPPF